MKPKKLFAYLILFLGISLVIGCDDFDGTIGTWSVTSSFTGARDRHTSVVNNGYLYVIGGFSEGAPANGRLNDIQFATINADGTLGSFNFTTPFPIARIFHSSVVHSGYLYILGGDDPSGQFINDVEYAPINSDGTIGAWNTTTPLPTARHGHRSVVNNGYLYIIGGWSDTAFNDVQYARINADGTIGSWNSTTPFTTARSGHSSVVNNGYLYVIGGNTGYSILDDVQYARINADGTIGAWNTTTPLPAPPRASHTSVVYKGYLYVIGGGTVESTQLDEVLYAPISANGTIGAWNNTSSLTKVHSTHSTVLYNKYLYVIGGVGLGSNYNDVEFAMFND
jgi:N-acetylneuraminic acid mutarotase